VSPANRRQSSTGPIRHDGPCGEREECWRPECGAFAAAGYRTVEVLVDGTRLAYCHKVTFRPVALAAEALTS
jgi:hypothetical protein